MLFLKKEYLNGNLAIILQGNYKGIEYNDVVSVNLVHCFTPKGYAYLDTNNYPFIANLIAQEQIGSDTGIVGRSGFCQYPLFEINEEKLRAES